MDVDAEPADLLVYKSPSAVAIDTQVRQEAVHAFHALPFALVRGDFGVSNADVVRRIQRYPIDRQRLLAGLDWFFSVKCDVINLSVGPRGQFLADDPLQIATRMLTEQSKTVVVAAGHYGPDESSLQALARAPWVISVAAVDSQRNVVKTSSRGGAGLHGPTFSSFGENPFVPGELGTSYAAPRVAAAAAYAQKALELIVSDLRTAQLGNSHEWSRPVDLPWIGIADTGIDSATATNHWGPIAASLLPEPGAIEIATTVEEQTWASAFTQAIEERHIPEVSPNMVETALSLGAIKLNYPPEVTGGGLITLATAIKSFRTLLPSQLGTILGFTHVGPLNELDGRLGPIWSPERFAIAEDVFGTGIRLSVAKVA
jgi:hypothetical protein